MQVDIVYMEAIGAIFREGYVVCQSRGAGACDPILPEETLAIFKYEFEADEYCKSWGMEVIQRIPESAAFPCGFDQDPMEAAKDRD